MLPSYSQLLAAALLSGSALLVLPPHHASHAAETLKIGGTGGALGTMKLMGSAFSSSHPETTIEVLPSLGSRGGVKAVLKGAIDIGLVSLAVERIESSKEMSVVEYASTALIFGTNTSCPLTGVTSGQLERIFSGEMSYWPCGNRVRQVLRPHTDSDTAIVKAISPAMSRAVELSYSRPGMMIATSDQAAAELLLGFPERFGTTTLSLIISEGRPLKILAYNGVSPTLQTLADGTYPLKKDFALVTLPHPPDRIRSFVDFVLSSAGREILRKAGNLPTIAVMEE